MQFIDLRNGATDNYVQYDLEHLQVKPGGYDMSAALTTKAMGMTRDEVRAEPIPRFLRSLLNDGRYIYIQILKPKSPILTMLIYSNSL